MQLAAAMPTPSLPLLLRPCSSAGILELVSPTEAVWRFYRNRDGGEPADEVWLTKREERCGR